MFLYRVYCLRTSKSTQVLILYFWGRLIDIWIWLLPIHCQFNICLCGVKSKRKRKVLHEKDNEGKSELVSLSKLQIQMCFLHCYLLLFVFPTLMTNKTLETKFAFISWIKISLVYHSRKVALTHLRMC